MIKGEILKIYDYLATHKIVGLSSFVIITALLVFSFFGLGYKEDISDFLPFDNERQAALDVYQDISGANKVFALFEHKDTVNINYDEMSSAVENYVEYLYANDKNSYVKDLTYKIDDEYISEITDFVYKNIPYFITQNDYIKLDSLVTSQNFVLSRLEQTKQILMLPSGGLLTENIQRDPLNIFTPFVLSLSNSSSKMSLDSYDGYILTPDSKYMIVMMTSPFGNSETENNTKLIELLEDAKAKISSKNPNIDIIITGGPVIAVGNSEQIKSDSVISIPLAIVLIIFILFYCCRNARNILLILVSIAWGWLFAIAVLALIHDKISLIVLGISSVILGIAVNYPLHLIAHLSHSTTIKTALKEIITPLIIGNITTVCAFCTLIPLNSVALSDLGIFSSLLLIGTILFVILFLPHIVKHRGKYEKSCQTKNDIISKISNLHIRDNKYVFIGIVIFTIILGYFGNQASFDSNMSNINYMSKEQRENMAYFNSLTQGIDNNEQNIYVVSRDSVFDNALAKSNQISDVLEQIVRQDSSLRYSRCTRFIASKEEQAKRIAEWNKFIEKNKAILITELQQQMKIAGFADGAFDDFNSILTQKYEAHLNVSPLMPVFTSNISCNGNNQGYSIIDIISAPAEKIESIESIIRSKCPEQYCFDIKSLNGVITKNLSNNFDYIGFACGILVFVFLWLSFGRLELALIAFCPMIISWTWILGLMGLFNIQFNIVNVILATFIFGQGDDYTIFITEGCMYEYAYRKKMLNSYRRSIIISALIMFVGIGALIFAKHPALYSLAQVTIIGMLSVVVTSFTVPPLIFKWLTMKDGNYRKRPLRLSASLRTWYCGVIWVGQLLIGYIIAAIMYICGCRSLKSREFFHKIVSRLQKLDLNIIPGVKLTIKNDYNEDFKKPCIIICNHQSMLDPAYLLQLHHKILIVGNEKSSLHPLVNGIFKWLNFYTVRKDNHKDWVDSCFERDIEMFKEYIKAGYSIAVFPEGIRNPESKIVRYHKGPFYLAKELDVDILPIFIHGLNAVMPIGSFEVNSNPVTMVINQRISTNSALWNDDYAIMTKNIHNYYVHEYQKLSKTLETANYFAPLVKDRYLYKGISIYSVVSSHLKKNKNYSEIISKINANKDILIIGCGFGEFSLLLSLTKPDLQIYAYDSDASKLDVAKSSANDLVNNLKYVDVLNLSEYQTTKVIKLDESGNVCEI